MAGAGGAWGGRRWRAAQTVRTGTRTGTPAGTSVPATATVQTAAAVGGGGWHRTCRAMPDEPATLERRDWPKMQEMIGMMMAMMLLAAATVDDTPAGFRSRLEAVAGQPVRLDPRIAIPACPSGYRMERRATAVEASCPDIGWRLVVPVAAVDAQPEATPLVRRGSAVVVEAVGAGFSVRIDGVAEHDAGAGDNVRVRNLRSGQRVMARLDADGRLFMDRR